jgi:hypothetical protein
MITKRAHPDNDSASNFRPLDDLTDIVVDVLGGKPASYKRNYSPRTRAPNLSRARQNCPQSLTYARSTSLPHQEQYSPALHRNTTCIRDHSEMY